MTSGSITRSVTAHLLLAAMTAAIPAPAAAQDPAPAETCVALVLPSVQGVEGSATDVASGVRDLFASYLTGPSIKTITLDARLPALAVQEARQKQCGHIVLSSLTRKRRSGGLGRALGQAAGAAAWHVPYTGSAAGNAVRGAAISGAYAASSIAATTQPKDEMTLEYRVGTLETALGAPPKRDTMKARSQGEDLLTPMVERAAEAILGVVMK